jgi:hypothetical protein
MNRTLLTMLICCLLSGTALAQETTGEQWHHYELDELVSISFPCEMPENMNWADSFYRCGDSTFRLWARVLDLREEIAAMGPVKQDELAELVYKTQMEKMSRYTTYSITRKLWRWKKQNFAMLMWSPTSSGEVEHFARIKAFPWGPGSHDVYPPFMQYDRMLFYNNKLYIFSMLTITEAYKDREYFMRGGMTEDQLRTLKEKFFRSIEIKKKPANKSVSAGYSKKAN